MGESRMKAEKCQMDTAAQGCACREVEEHSLQPGGVAGTWALRQGRGLPAPGAIPSRGLDGSLRARSLFAQRGSALPGSH